MSDTNLFLLIAAVTIILVLAFLDFMPMLDQRLKLELTLQPAKAGLKAPTYPLKFTLDDKVFHPKTKGTYVVTGLPGDYYIEATGEPAYAYRSLTGGPVFVRAQRIMEDGRFITLVEKG